MTLYLDTNIFLARYAPEEPHHREAKTLINRVERGEQKALTSTLTLIETTATISRTYATLQKPPYSREKLVGAYLKKIVNTSNLEFIPQGGDISLSLGEKTLDISATYSLAIEVASVTQLKSLDALHIASALTASRVYGHQIDYFVTLDDGILKQGEALETMNIRAVSPANLVA